MPETPAARQARRRNKQRLRGLVRMDVWIPDSDEARAKLADFLDELAKFYGLTAR